MKFAKKKKTLPLIWIAIPAAVLVVAVIILVCALSGAQGSGDPTDPTLTTGAAETESQAAEATETTETQAAHTDPSETAGEDIGEETQASQPTEQTEATEQSRPTEETKATDPTKPTENEQTKPTESPDTPKEDHTTLKTPYGTLKYPEEWADFLRAEVKEGEPYVVTYFADLESGKTQELFTISFGGDQDTALGTITSGGKTVPVHVSSTNFKPDNSWSEKEINIVFTMHEAMNDLLDALNIQTNNQPSQDEPNLPKEDGEEMIIDTPYCELRYPSRWMDYLDLKVNDKNGYSVEFRCKLDGHNPVSLFVVYFGGNKGIVVGSAADNGGKYVDIRLEALEINLNDSWTEDEKRIIAAMQEDLNFLLSKLN